MPSTARLGRIIHKLQTQQMLPHGQSFTQQYSSSPRKKGSHFGELCCEQLKLHVDGRVRVYLTSEIRHWPDGCKRERVSTHTIAIQAGHTGTETMLRWIGKSEYLHGSYELGIVEIRPSPSIYNSTRFIGQTLTYDIIHTYTPSGSVEIPR